MYDAPAFSICRIEKGYGESDVTKSNSKSYRTTVKQSNLRKKVAANVKGI